MHHCRSPLSTLSSPVMVVATSGGGGRTSFYSCSPPITSPTNTSSCKEHGCAGWGGLPPPKFPASSPHAEGTGRAGARHSAPLLVRRPLWPPPWARVFYSCWCHHRCCHRRCHRCCCRRRRSWGHPCLLTTFLRQGRSASMGGLGRCSSPTHINQYWFEEEGDAVPRYLHHLGIRRRHAPIQVLAPPP